MSDEIARRAVSGDQEAFAELVRMHGADVLRVCMLYTADRSLAQDAAQEAWHKAWQKKSNLRDPLRYRAWVMTIAANEARQLTRRRSRRPTEPIWEAVATRDGAAAAEVVDVQLALRRLPASDREILAWRYGAGLTSEEIAAHLGISPEGVRSRMKRIRDRLREELE